MKRLVSKISFLTLAVAGHAVLLPVFAQITNRGVPLPVDKTLTRDLAGAEVQFFRVKLKAGEFLQVRVEQNGVDVALRLVNADGTPIASMDSPNGTSGPETLSFISAAVANYTLEVAALDPHAPRGSYTIRRQANRKATAVDRRRVDVERSFVDGMNARSAAGQIETALTKLGEALLGWRELNDEYLADLTARQIVEVKRAKAMALYNEAHVLIEQQLGDSYVTALEKFAESTTIFQEIDDKSETAGLALLGSGLVWTNLGKPANALRFFESAIVFFRNNNFKTWEAVTLKNIGRVYADVGEYQKSLNVYGEALRFFRQTNNKAQVADTLNNIGLVYDSLDDNKKALEMFEQALPLCREAAEKTCESNTIGNMASVLDELGENERALDLYSKALVLSRELGNKGSEAITLNNAGLLYKKLGQSQRALEHYAQALKLFQLTGDKVGAADTINNIAATYNDLGDPKKGLEFYNIALTIYNEADDKEGQATALNNIGSAYNDLGENQKALEYYGRSLDRYKEIGSKTGQAGALNNLGGTYDRMGQKDRAMEFFVLALPIIQETGDKGFEGLLLNNIGKVLDDMGEYQKALDHYGRSLPLRRQAGDLSGEAATLSNLMFVWSVMDNGQIAALYGKQSVNRFQQLRTNITGLSKRLQKTYLASVEPAYRKLADVLIEQGNFAQAERVLSMLKDEEYFDFVRRDASEIAKLDERVPLNEKEKALIAQYAQLADKITQLGQEFIKLDDKKRLLSRSELTLSMDEQRHYDELEKQLDAANAAFQLFINKGLAAEIGKEKAKEIEVDRNLQSKLRQWGEGTVALYTIAGADRYRVVLTTPKTQVDGKSEIKIADLNKKIFEFRNALQNPKVDPRPLGKELYDILIKPIEKDLRAAKAKTLVWSLDGTLRYIPLAALSPDGKRYLAEDVQNVIITAKTRDDMSDSNATWQGLGLGVSEKQTVADPEDNTRSIPFDPLPGTESELMAIVKDERFGSETGLLLGRRFMNKDFTAAALKDSLVKENPDGTRKYNLIHIASHFRLGSNWANSFLLLGGGNVLSLEEINNSSTIDFGNVDLITLSACNTAFADDSNGKEIDSLASVIQTKSGKAVLATLWPVADESTSMLMSEFYRLRKLNPKLTKAGAMQLAQQAMIAGKLRSSGTSTPCRSDKIDLGDTPAEFKCNTNAPFAHPYFWAPFVLIGNWR